MQCSCGAHRGAPCLQFTLWMAHHCRKMSKIPDGINEVHVVWCAGQSLGLVENWSQIDWNKVQYLLAFGYTPWWVQPTPSASVITGAHFNSSRPFRDHSVLTLPKQVQKSLQWHFGCWPTRSQGVQKHRRDASAYHGLSSDVFLVGSQEV